MGEEILTNFRVEFASSIDTGSTQPGRCAEACGLSDSDLLDLGLGDVMVTASEDGEFIQTSGQNNEWVVTANGPALMCSMVKDALCLGMTGDMSFTMTIERAE